MKKKLIILCSVLSFRLLAQTNSFPSTGNISIGAPSNLATAKLHLLEGVALGGSQNSSQIITRIGGNSGSANNVYNNVWLVRSETNSADWWTLKIHDALSLDNAYLTPGSDTKTFWERHAFADRQSWGTGNNPYMTLLGGRLGVGIYTPAARLDIQEDNNAFSTFIARNLHTTGGGYCILSNVKQDLTKAFAIANTSTGWAENFVVYGNGRTMVGVKRILPTHIHADAFVQIDGKVACKELVVLDPTKWSDFVFAPDYKLRGLDDLERYYLQNKHLPDVPSENDVKQNGINTAEMDAILLQKIEELTLYIVNMNKELQALKAENQKLSTKLK